MQKIILLFSIILVQQTAFAQWIQLNGPIGGPVNCVLNNNGIFYAGTGDAVFVSANRGASWVKKDSGMVDWNAVTNAFAAIGNTVFAASDGGVFKSSNQGASWEPAHSTQAYFNTVTSLYADGNRLYEGTNDSGVFVSPDAGITWNWLGKNLSISAVSMVYASGNRVFTGGYNNGLFISLDSGKTWAAGDTTVSKYSLNGITAYNGKLYTGTTNGTYVSKDSGTTWKQLGANSPAGSSYVFRGSYIFAANFGLSVSTDSGATWNYVNNLKPYTTGLILTGDTLFAGTTEGMYWSKDSAKTWHADNTGLCNANVYSVAVNGNYIFAATDSGIYLSVNDGNTWKSAGSGLSSTTINALAFKGTKLFAAGSKGVFVSSDYGNTWNAINTGLPASPNIFTIGVCDNLIYISGGYSPVNTYVSTNEGASWNQVNTGLSTSNYVKAFATVSDTAYATVYTGFYYSIDTGKHWLAVNTGGNGYDFGGIAISGNHIVVGGDDVIYSNDAGAYWGDSWSPIFNRDGITTAGVVNDTSYVGDAFGGMYMTPDNCGNWYASSPIEFSVNTFTTSNGTIYMGGLNSGVWKHISSNSIATNAQVIKKSDNITLYPNPAETSITINTGVNSATQQTVSVYNVLGKLEIQQSNNLPVFNMDISSFPAGMYLIKVSGENGDSEMKKFVKQW